MTTTTRREVLHGVAAAPGSALQEAASAGPMDSSAPDVRARFASLA